jgi:hypothetical protein
LIVARFIFVVFLLLSNLSYASFDLSAGTNARSYPGVGGEAYIESGYNAVLWGKGIKKNPLYGLVRPAVRFSSSGVINSYDARVEFFPISFLGFVRGYQHINSRFEKFNFYNCENVRCTGDIKRDYTKAKLALGALGFISIVELTISHNEYSGNGSEPVAEFRFATLAEAGQDSFNQSRYVLAYKHDKGVMGILTQYTKFSNSGQSHNMDLFIYSQRSDRTVYTFGAGQFMSSHWARGFVAVFQMRTNFLDTKAIF